VDFDTDDRTVVAGASALVGLRRGDVVGNRYEVRERLRDDAFTLDYRALDRRTQERVRLREVRPGLLAGTTAVHELLEGLNKVVGLGGAFLPGLRDVGQDRDHVYVVEDWPNGMCISDLLARRAGQGRPLQPKELLPVVARLNAALAAIPETWHHGDVRARQVWIDAGHLQLTGAFLLDAMPNSALTMVLHTNPELRPYYAPEVAEGWAGTPADRYGVAAMVWEGLLAQAPPTAGQTSAAVRRLGPLGDALSQLLSPDPMDRPDSLTPLLEALARASGKPVPKLDPAPFRPKQVPVSRQRRRDTIPAPPPGFDASAPRTAARNPLPSELVAPAAAPGADDEWDAMPTRQFDRSAMLEDAPEVSVEEVDAGEIELEVDDLEPAPARRQAAPARRQAAPRAAVPIPAGIKPMPRARQRPADAPVTRPSRPPEPAVVVDASAHQAPERPRPQAPPAQARAVPPQERVTLPTPKPTAARSTRSLWVVLLAFAAAAAILVGSLLFAQQRRLMLEAEKRERIQQRLEQLRQESGDEGAPTAPGP
jgi:hypothetical protein